jgi:hypothetical protein
LVSDSLSNFILRAGKLPWIIETGRTVGAGKFSKRPVLNLSFQIKIRRSITLGDRASFRSGEIRILDSTGNVESVIPFTEADRKL